MPIGTIQRLDNGKSSQENKMKQKVQKEVLKSVPKFKFSKQELNSRPRNVPNIKEILERRREMFKPAPVPVDSKISGQATEAIISGLAMPAGPHCQNLRNKIEKDEYMVSTIQEKTNSILGKILGISTGVKFALHYGIAFTNAKGEQPMPMGFKGNISVPPQNKNFNNKTNDGNKDNSKPTNLACDDNFQCLPNGQELLGNKRPIERPANKEECRNMQSNNVCISSRNSESSNLNESGFERNEDDAKSEKSGEV